MRFEFTGDELILTLVSLIRAVNPAMLQQGPEGFMVDFGSLDRKGDLNGDERLLLKLRAALETETPDLHAVDLAKEEGRRLAATLVELTALQNWAPDVQEMSRSLCARLAAVR
jgi:hypothetical protein